MPNPARYDFDCVRGTTPGFGVTIQQTNPTTSVLEPADFTDIRLSVKAGSTMFQAKLTDAGPIITEGTPGVFTILFPAAWTRAMKIGVNADGSAKNSYELELVNGPLFEMVYLIGNITATGGINVDA